MWEVAAEEAGVVEGFGQLDEVPGVRGVDRQPCWTKVGYQRELDGIAEGMERLGEFLVLTGRTVGVCCNAGAAVERRSYG